jgi:hypothetical protein
MDLVDRYVYAVKRHLPANQQDDIVNELTDDIMSQIKDKEEELGRPLDEADQEAVIRHYGHPYVLAMRYRRQQHLIGPALFPFYFPALKIAMALAFAVQVIVAFSIGLGQNAPEGILPRILGFPAVAIQVVFWVTVAFAVADYWQAKLHLFEKWSPRTLPSVTTATRHPKRTSLVVEVVANVLFLAWWVTIPTYPFLMLGPAAAFLSFSPSWSRLYLVMFVPPLVSTLTAVGILVRPSWAWLSRLRPLLVNLAGLFVVSVALNAGNLVVPAKDSADLARLVKGINDVTTLVLIVIALIAMVQVMVDVVRLVRSETA